MNLIARLKSSSIGCFLRTAPSLAKIVVDPKVSFARKKACVDFFRTGSGARHLIASLPRSGYHYLNLMNDVAMDLEAGGDGGYHFDFGWFHSNGGHHGVGLDWRWKSGNSAFEPLPPVILNTHLPYYLNSSLAVGAMRTVILIRDMWDILDSLIHRYELTPDIYDTFLRSQSHPDAKPYVKIDFPMMIAFIDTWAATLKRNDVMIMRYENLQAAPEKELRRFRDFMQLEISDSNLDRAVRLCTKENMGKVIGNTGETVHRVRFEKQPVPFTDAQLDFIIRSLENSRYPDYGYSPTLPDRHRGGQPAKSKGT